jgi:hypothetical protein
VTLPTQSVPEADRARHSPARRRISSPAALVAVVAVTVLVAVLCVLGAMFSGLFGYLSFSDTSGTESAPPTVQAPSQRSASTQFDDGQWLVGTDVVPGTYSATVPAGSPGCSWERDASTDGTASSVLESGLGKDGDHLVVTIKDSDVIFQSHDCGVWLRTGD